MDLQRIRYFMAVAEELHFGRAAARLRMAQPPLSRQIRQLESELGVKLFDRTTRHVALTTAGETIYEYAQKLISSSDDLERWALDFTEGTSGLLRVGFVDSSAFDVMPAFLQAHRRRWPRVRYHLSTMSSDQQHAALVAGEIDIGIARVLRDKAELRAVPFLTEDLFLAVGESHPLADRKNVRLAELADEAFIGFDRLVSPSLHEELLTILVPAGIVYQPIIEAPEYTTILGIVAAGEGVAIIPDGVRAFRPSALRYVRLADPSATMSMMMIARRVDQRRIVEHALSLVGELFVSGQVVKSE